MKTEGQLRFAERKAQLNTIESFAVEETKLFAEKLTLMPDLLGGIPRETVDFVLATIFEAGLKDQLEIIRSSKKTGKYARQYITNLFLTR